MVANWRRARPASHDARMTKKMTLIGFALLSAAAAACGGDGGSPVAFEDLPNEAASAFCQHAFDCCSEAELMEQLSGFDPVPTTVAECATALVDMGFIDFSDEEAGIAAGTVTYNADAAGDCVAALAALA